MGAEYAVRLCAPGLTGEELNVALFALLGVIPGDIPEAVAPLYSRGDKEELLQAIPIYNEWGSSRATTRNRLWCCPPARATATRIQKKRRMMTLGRHHHCHGAGSFSASKTMTLMMTSSHSRIPHAS